MSAQTTLRFAADFEQARRQLVTGLSRTFGYGWSAIPHGPDGIALFHRSSGLSVIVTHADFDGVEWRHASIASSSCMPSYDDLRHLHRVVFGDAFAYQQFVPSALHVNIHSFALHLWGRVDGRPGQPPVITGGSV